MPDQDFRTSKYVSLEMRGMNDAEKSSPEKDTSKFLKVAQIPAIAMAFRIAPKQSAKHLCRNLENNSLEKQIDPALVECVLFKVLTWQGLDCRYDVSSP